jgi:hypothetical protein
MAAKDVPRGTGVAVCGSQPMAAARANRRCDWLFGPGKRCRAPAQAYDRDWERWLCEDHYRESLSKLWGYTPPEQIARPKDAQQDQSPAA